MSHLPTRRLLVLLAALVGLLALGGATVGTGGSAAPNLGDATDSPFPPPALTGASTTDRVSGVLHVTGVDFTPGGRVEVAFYDQSGAELIETSFVTATATVYGRDWHAPMSDLTVGYTRAGVISAAFAPACGRAAKVRAYDQASARWSGWLELAPAC